MSRDRVLAASALALSLAYGATAWAWRTAAVGGSDSACYSLMAAVFAQGAVQPMSGLVRDAPWPEASLVAAPAGFLPSAIRPEAAVPVCAPGYSLLVAPILRLAGPSAVHAVPPIAATLLVWLVFVLARRLHSAWAGLTAALLVAGHPIVLFQAVQPMNDITTGAIWVAAAVAACAARPVATGLLVGLGLLVRPNLLPAAAAVVLTCAWMAADDARNAWLARGLRAAAVASGAALPGVVMALGLNAVLYGSPLQSGYGNLDALFAWRHVPVNIALYGGTWIHTGTPVVLLALAAPWLVAPGQRTRATALVAICASLSAVYLAYRPFDEWWYLRFLLPAVATAAALTGVALVAAATRVWPRGGGATAAAMALVVATHGWRSAEAGEARGLRALESRFAETAHVVATRLDPGAVPITVWQSGGLRFWPGRDVLVWDALDPAWLDHAMVWLRQHGRQPVIVVERWEEHGFRTRFAGQEYGGLDWPPRFDIDRRVRIFLPEDREPYLQGAPVPTEFVAGPRRVR